MYTRRADGIFIIHLDKLWEKIIFAARVIATVLLFCNNSSLQSLETGENLFVTSSSLQGRRPASKIATYLKVSCNMGRFSPGIFTKSFQERRLLLCMDPYDDHQAITESSKCSIPVAFVNSHSFLKFVNITIPCNNTGYQSTGVLSYLLTRLYFVFVVYLTMIDLGE
jgi:small subunit ribosomal protein SAe